MKDTPGSGLATWRSTSPDRTTTPASSKDGDGTIHVVYSYFVQQKPVDGGPAKEGKSMKHVAVNEAWIQAGDEK